MRWACGKAGIRKIFCPETLGIRIPSVSRFVPENGGHRGPLWGREVEEQHARIASWGVHTGFRVQRGGRARGDAVLMLSTRGGQARGVGEAGEPV